MQVSACNLLFHPFHTSHSSTEKVLSVVTIVALSILTCGLYIPLLVAVNLGEWVWSKMHPSDSLEITGNDSAKISLQRPVGELPLKICCIVSEGNQVEIETAGKTTLKDLADEARVKFKIPNDYWVRLEYSGKSLNLDQNIKDIAWDPHCPLNVVKGFGVSAGGIKKNPELEEKIPAKLHCMTMNGAEIEVETSDKTT